ncbi:MAG: hypothetical protein M3295_09495 [Chloroflexota bacterium]|nr:hypothetical protein [Chloroflexota bacterium]
MSGERRVVPPRPTLGASIRLAGEALYYNSGRFVGANLVFGAVVVAFLLAASLGVVGYVVVVALVPPSVGVMSMATRYVRDGHVAFSDFGAGIRERFWRHLALGIAQLALIVVALADALIGLAIGGVPGVALTTLAVYALIALWAFAVVAWPLILDPVRRDEPLRATFRVALVLAVAQPIRMLMLATVIGVLLVLATLFIVVVLSFALALAFLIAALYVLPAADRLEDRATLEVEPED